MNTETAFTLLGLIWMIWSFLVLIGIKKVLEGTSNMILKINEGYNLAIAAGAVVFMNLILGWGYLQILICVFFLLAVWATVVWNWHKIKDKIILNRLVLIALLFFKWFFLSTYLLYDTPEKKEALNHALSLIGK